MRKFTAFILLLLALILEAAMLIYELVTGRCAICGQERRLDCCGEET